MYIIFCQTFVDCIVNFMPNSPVQIVQLTALLRPNILYSQAGTGKDLDTIRFQENMQHPAVHHTVPTQIMQHRYAEDLRKSDSPEAVPWESGEKQQMYWQQDLACTQKSWNLPPFSNHSEVWWGHCQRESGMTMCSQVLKTF